MGKTATAQKPKTAVTLGWVVKKRFMKKEKDAEGREVPKWFDKTISKLYTGRTAADTFRELAEKYKSPGVGEHEVSYYVSEHGGHDDLPAGL